MLGSWIADLACSGVQVGDLGGVDKALDAKGEKISGQGSRDTRRHEDEGLSFGNNEPRAGGRPIQEVLSHHGDSEVDLEPGAGRLPWPSESDSGRPRPQPSNTACHTMYSRSVALMVKVV